MSLGFEDNFTHALFVYNDSLHLLNILRRNDHAINAREQYFIDLGSNETNEPIPGYLTRFNLIAPFAPNLHHMSK